MTGDRAEDPALTERLASRLDDAGKRLAQAQPFAKFTQSAPVLDVARRLMAAPGGVQAAYERIGALTDAGVFQGSDWEEPDRLQPQMAANTLKLSQDNTLILECLSELRLVAIAEGALHHERLSPDQARQFLARVMALNLRFVFGSLTEADRVKLGRYAELVQQHQRFVAERIGVGEVMEELIEEIWRILAQRPIQVEPVQEMITSIAAYLHSDDPAAIAASPRGAERLISALYGPTRTCQEDPGIEVFQDRLLALDEQNLRNEALGFGRAMHDTGLVSAYHAVFLRYALENHADLLAPTLGLSSTGIEALSCYPDLVRELIRAAIWPETAQAIYGLAGLLESGLLFSGPIAPGLWRQLHLEPCLEARQRLGLFAEEAHPGPRARILAGVLNILGQPRGIGQGDNPTCQAARALSLWATNDPSYLLQVITWAVRDNDVSAEFEGQPLSSRQLLQAAPIPALLDVDPVSAVTVPHLDAIYMEMGRRCVARGEDPHRWVNPEFHGWWVGRGFAIAVDVATGALTDLNGFFTRFHACYHPHHNGNNPLIHPQPAGIAVTDSAAQFVGWHAISIERVTLDPSSVMRVYFFNPNNDSTQDWGNGVHVSTEGCGERNGESSLPFEQFASRLYIFHFDPRDEEERPEVPQAALERITMQVVDSWGAGRGHTEDAAS